MSTSEELCIIIYDTSTQCISIQLFKKIKKNHYGVKPGYADMW